MTDFATDQDLEEFWRPLHDAERDRANVLLGYASAEIRAEYPDIDDRIADDANLGVNTKRVTLSMVKRAMISGPGGDGVAEVQQSYGSIGVTSKYANPAGDLYLLEKEKRLLSKSGPGRKAFTINMVNTAAGTGVESLPYWGAEQQS